MTCIFPQLDNQGKEKFDYWIEHTSANMDSEDQVGLASPSFWRVFSCKTLSDNGSKQKPKSSKFFTTFATKLQITE